MSSSSESAAASASVAPPASLTVVNMYDSQRDQTHPCFICAHDLFLVIVMLPFLPFFLLNAMFCGGCFRETRVSMSNTHQKVTVDAVNRVITLREFMRLWLSADFELVREQSISFDRIHGFKCAKSERWVEATGYMLLVAVSRPLGNQPDGALPLATASHAPGPPYHWPAFVDRSVFEGGDLLPINYYGIEDVTFGFLSVPEAGDGLSLGPVRQRIVVYATPYPLPWKNCNN